MAVLGAGGHGRVVADVAMAAGWESVSFFDDAFPEKQNAGVWKVVGTAADLLKQCNNFDGVIVGIGDNGKRLQWHSLLQDAGALLVTLVHPRAWVSPHAQLASGCVVVGGAIINVGAFVGHACIVNTGATVDHDCILADAVHISPGAHLAGQVAVGARSWIGIGAAVRQLQAIGHDVIIGAGSVVITDISDNATAFGCPAKRVG